MAHTPLKVFTKMCCGPHAVDIWFFRFLRILQNVRVVHVALRIRCLQKSIEIVDVLKTNGKPMVLHDFCVGFVSDRRRSFLSRLGAFAS